MTMLAKLCEKIIGEPLNPLDPKTRRTIAVIPVLAWVGLGADGLSSSCYGPEQAFLALRGHPQLGLYLAVATALTVFIISIGYNQVIELFPTGGGGYRVATALLGPRTGLVSGAALLVDYVLTISTSIAGSVDAFFSILPPGTQAHKLTVELAIILLLILLNFRGMKQSILVLLPIFMGFVILHVGLISYGLLAHAERLPTLLPNTQHETARLSQSMGGIFVASLLLRAFSMGGGTFTGLEAVSNNVNMLAEPRITNGRWTMFYMALSLAFTATGIILLYMLWGAKPVAGQTLNAVVFGSVIGHMGIGSHWVSSSLLILVLVFEAGLLLVGAQTGFLDGPTVLSNMAADYWVPRHFRDLSGRLVRQNGVIVMGLASIAILLWTQGEVASLVVLYSINVFLTFSLSLFGLCVYWWRHRRRSRIWPLRILLSAAGFSVAAGILAVTLIEKFTEGAWLTVLVTSSVVWLCFLVRSHYDRTRAQLAQADALFAGELVKIAPEAAPKIDKVQPTAIVLVGKHRGASMHALLWVQRLFPDHFKNFVFLAVGTVDAQSFFGQEQLHQLGDSIKNAASYYTIFCQMHGLAAEARVAFGTDAVDEFTKLVERTMDDYPNSVCFASKLIFRRTNFLTARLHNQAPLDIQERLHLSGRHMVLLPMQVNMPS